MTLAEICFLPVSFICGLIRYFSGWNNVSKTADFKPSGLGTGWVCVILLVIVAAIVLNENSDRIWQFLLQHGFVILSIALIFITLYLKGNFSGWNIDSKTAALTTNGLGTGLICVILVFVTVVYILLLNNPQRLLQYLGEEADWFWILVIFYCMSRHALSQN
ncbi:hypothetical protein Bca4012_006451 [Brassica carinata]|uniref:Uncharacterized protein n=1 Tax=Brassica carinata TaxID=52824 RepID=A0A8X7RSV4_BRACI|nr:hypothetical protein Bca52824_039352 [Brassica carinata]